MSKNSLWLDMRCDEGRAQLNVDIESLSDMERLWLFRLLEGTRQGREVGFGVQSTDDGAQVLTFTISNMETPSHAVPS